MKSSKFKQVLFLCSGNYYRSRFAEILFNHHAHERDLNWRAISRGLSREIGPWKTGPISVYALAGLSERGLEPPEPHREPLYCTEDDLTTADIVIALKEAEHRPMVTKLFPNLDHRVEYWHIHDIDAAKPETALAELEQLLWALIHRLQQSTTQAP